MTTFGNVLWLVLVGWWLAIGYLIAGFLTCITIIGIPLGIQAFKLAGYALWPFGRSVVEPPDADHTGSTVANIAWVILGGWWLALLHIVAGLVMFITIIGIPLGLASFKMAGLAFLPFGKEIVDDDDVRVYQPSAARA